MLCYDGGFFYFCSRKNYQTIMDYDFLHDFETSLQESLLKICTTNGMLSGTLLASDDIDQRWHDLAPEYMADAVKEIAQYPSVALAWASYLGMAIANGWDTDWEKCRAMGYSEFYGPRGFDDMDEHIVYDIIGLNPNSDEANRLEETLRTIAEHSLSQIRHSGIEPQSPMAFHTFARACKVLYRTGAAIELHRLGYKFEAVNLN
jgi:hypothetical protein